MIAVPSYSETVSWDQLVENPSDGLVYKKFSSTPFTGLVMPDLGKQDVFKTKKRIKASFKDGLYHGRYEKFCENGLVFVLNNFKEGELHGNQKSFNCTTGHLWSDNNYKDGQNEGIWLTFHDSTNGALQSKYTMEKGLFKYAENFYDNGQLESKGAYDDSGEKVGIWEYFYSDGLLKKKGRYNNGMFKLSD